MKRGDRVDLGAPLGEAVHDRGTGLRVDPVSPDALSQALARLTDATQSLDTMPPDPELTRDELTRDNDR